MKLLAAAHRVQVQRQPVPVGVEFIPQQWLSAHAVERGKADRGLPGGKAHRQPLGLGPVVGGQAAGLDFNKCQLLFLAGGGAGQHRTQAGPAGGQIGADRQRGHGIHGRRGQLKAADDAVPVGLGVLGDLVGPGLALQKGGVHGVGHACGGVVHLDGERVVLARAAESRKIVAVRGGVAGLPGPGGHAVQQNPALFGALQLQQHGPPAPVGGQMEAAPVGGGAGVNKIPVQVAGGEALPVVGALAVFIHCAGQPHCFAGKNRVIGRTHAEVPGTGKIQTKRLFLPGQLLDAVQAGGQIAWAWGVFHIGQKTPEQRRGDGAPGRMQIHKNRLSVPGWRCRRALWCLCQGNSIIRAGRCHSQGLLKYFLFLLFGKKEN